MAPFRWHAIVLLVNAVDLSWRRAVVRTEPVLESSGVKQANGSLPDNRSEDNVNHTNGETGDRFNIPVLVINLDERWDRWQIMREHLKSLEIDPVRVPAISTSGPNKFETDEHVVRWMWNTSWNAKLDPRVVPNQVLSQTESEYATCLSHVKAWRLIVEKNLPAALILEDDAVLGENFYSVISAALREVPPAWDVLYPGYFYPATAEHRNPIKVSEHIYTSEDGVFGAHAYILTQTGARKLLKLLPVVQPVDGFLAMKAYRKQLAAYLVEPQVAWQSTFEGSDIYHSAMISGRSVYEQKALFTMRKLMGNWISITRAWLEQHFLVATLLLLVVVLIAGHFCRSHAKCLSWASCPSRRPGKPPDCLASLRKETLQL